MAEFPTTVATFPVLEDDITDALAEHQMQRSSEIVAVQQKVGPDADPVGGTSLESRTKQGEGGFIQRHVAIPSAATLTLPDNAALFPITGSVAVATIAAPAYARLVYLEVVDGLTLVHGTGNLSLPSSADVDVPAKATVMLQWDGTAWKLVGGGADAPPVDPIAATPGLRTLGTGAQQAAAGNDTRFTNARTPTTHAGTHVNTAQDPIPAFTSSTRGLVPPPGGTPSGVKALYDNGTWRDPALASGGMSNPMTTAGDILVGGVAGAPDRLGIGTDGQILVVDPTTHLLAWADPAATVPSHDHSGSTDGGTLDGPVVNDFVDFVQGTTTTPAADHGRLHAGLISGILHPFWMDETGADVDLLAGGGGGGAGSVDVADEGGGPVAATELNFVGAGVTAAVSGGVATVTIPGGGGGGGGAEPGIAPQVAPPNAASWTLINPLTVGTPPNTRSTTLTDGVDGVVHMLVMGSTGANAQLAVKPMPATPFTIKARLRMNLRGAGNSLAGLCFYSTSDGKLTSVCIQNNTPIIYGELQYPAVTSATGQDTQEAATFPAARDIWFMITDDGSTHRTYSYSLDGDDATWVKLSDVSPTHFHTPDRVGFYGDPQSVNRDVYATLVSWEES